MKVALIAVLVLVLAGVVVLVRVKGILPLGWGWHAPLNAPSGLAIGGYDPVAYFSVGKPEAGDKSIVLNWNGVEWRFASTENRDAFAEDPEHYAPRFGGYCSFAVSKGFTAVTDPNIWHIENDRLYLFNSADFREKWMAERDKGVIQKCERNWGT